MEHFLIVKLNGDMSPFAVEELRHAIALWRGVRSVEWQEGEIQAHAAALQARLELVEALANPVVVLARTHAVSHHEYMQKLTTHGHEGTFQECQFVTCLYGRAQIDALAAALNAGAGGEVEG